MSYLLTFIAGGISTAVAWHYRGWILAKIGVNFPPKPPAP